MHFMLMMLVKDYQDFWVVIIIMGRLMNYVRAVVVWIMCPLKL